jgi:hypothetical protein
LERTKQLGLLAVAGLVFAFARRGKQLWSSWEQFFTDWFVHTFGLAAFTGLLMFAIISSHRFFLGYELEDYQDVTFYVLMTLLFAALGMIALGHWTPPSGFDDSLNRLVLFS